MTLLPSAPHTHEHLIEVAEAEEHDRAGELSLEAQVLVADGCAHGRQVYRVETLSAVGCIAGTRTSRLQDSTPVPKYPFGPRFAPPMTSASDRDRWRSRCTRPTAPRHSPPDNMK